MAHERYRVTRAGFDVVSVFGSLSAAAVPGTVITAVLTERGWTASNVRNQVTRLLERGVLTAERAGRHTVYQLAPAIARRFNSIRGCAETPAYDGYFYAIFYSIPETERGLRDRLLYAARYGEFHLLRPGVLIGLSDSADFVLGTTGEASPDSWMITGRVTPADLSEARRMAAIAFDLADMWKRIGELRGDVAKVVGDEACSGNRYFDVFYRASSEFMQLPHLPAELVDGPRPEQELGALMGQLLDVFGRRYSADCQKAAQQASGADLIEYVPWGEPISAADRPSQPVRQSR